VRACGCQLLPLGPSGVRRALAILAYEPISMCVPPAPSFPRPQAKMNHDTVSTPRRANSKRRSRIHSRQSGMGCRRWWSASGANGNRAAATLWLLSSKRALPPSFCPATCAWHLPLPPAVSPREIPPLRLCRLHAFAACMSCARAWGRWVCSDARRVLSRSPVRNTVMPAHLWTCSDAQGMRLRKC